MNKFENRIDYKNFFLLQNTINNKVVQDFIESYKDEIASIKSSLNKDLSKKAFDSYLVIDKYNAIQVVEGDEVKHKTLLDLKKWSNTKDINNKDLDLWLAYWSTDENYSIIQLAYFYDIISTTE